MKRTLCMILAVLLVACSLPIIITSYADDSENLLANATYANGDVSWTSKMDPRTNLADSKAESVYGGYSWTFGLGYGDVVGNNYEYVNIKATGLTIGENYDFSYIYQRDFIFAIDSIKSAGGTAAEFADPATSTVADKARSYKVATSFMAPASGDYIIKLKINRDMRPADCQWDTVCLSDLVLTKVESKNFLKNATHANGDVTWTTETDVANKIGNINPWGASYQDNTANAAAGGYSWMFGLGDGRVGGNTTNATDPNATPWPLYNFEEYKDVYAYVYIKAKGLTADTSYDFSYIYQEDYVISLDKITDANGNAVALQTGSSDNPYSGKERSYQVSATFKAPVDGDYTISLKLNRYNRTADCAWAKAILSDLSLTEAKIVNILKNATHANGDVTWTTTTDVANKIGNIEAWTGTHSDNVTNAAAGGYSWIFGLGDGRVGGNTNDATNPNATPWPLYNFNEHKDVYAYVYIKAKGLTANTRYTFSYIYQEDYVISLDKITDANGNAVTLESEPTDTPYSGKARSYIVSTTFKAPADGSYTIALKVNRYNRTADCAWSKVILSDLVLVKATTPLKVKAEAVVSGNGDISVSNNTPEADTEVTYKAIPWQGEEFLGWYNGDNKVSDNAEYTFTITEDTTLTAKFTSKNLNVLAGKDASEWTGYEWAKIHNSTESLNGGKAYKVSAAMYQSMYTTVTLKPNAEYTLSFNWKSAESDKGHSYPDSLKVISTADANIEDRSNWIDGGNYSPKNATNLIGAVEYPTPDMAKTEQWQSMSTTFTTSGDTEYNLVLKFGLTGSPADQVVYISDFILAENSNEPPSISDKDATEWTPYQWSKIENSTESRYGGKAYLVRDAMYQNIYTSLTLKPDTKYNLSFEWKSVANAKGPAYPNDIVVVSKDDIDIDDRSNWVESDFKYGAYDLETGGNLNSNKAGAESLEWQNTTVSFTTKSATEYSLLIHFQVDGAGNQHIYLSDFKLEEVTTGGGEDDEDDSDNLAATYSNASGNVTWTDNAGPHYADKPSDIEGGLSWKFGIPSTNFYGGIGDAGVYWDPAYVYIKTDSLEANHTYEFSYIYSKDFRIVFDSVDNNANVFYTDEVKLLEGDRANRVTIRFTTEKAGAHTIALKMGKGMNNENCAWDGVVLSDLKLYDITNRIYGKISSELGGTAEGFDAAYCTRGDEITLTATPLSGNTFEGWFDAEGNKVSDQAVYTFIAESNFDYVACFNGTNVPNVEWLEQHGMDGTFENGTMSGWVAEDRDHGDDTSWAFFERSTDMPYNGDYSFKVRARYRTSFFNFTNLKKNTDYHLSFYVNDPEKYIKKTGEPIPEGEVDPSNEEALIRNFDVTINGVTVYSDGASNATPSVWGGSGWYRISIYFNTGDNTEAEWSFYYTDKNNPPLEYIYMDDISLTEYTSAAFDNGDFADGTASWRGDFTVEDGVGKGTNIYQNVNLGKQSLYTVSFKAKGKGVGGAAKISTKPIDATSYISSESAVSIDSEDFENYTFNVYSGVHPDASLFFNATEGELLIDDVKVTKHTERNGAIVEKIDFESDRFALKEESDVFEIYSGTEGDENVHSGTKSLRFNSANAEEGVSYLLNEAFASFQIAEKTNYRLRIYYKTTSGNSLYISPEYLPNDTVVTTYKAENNDWNRVEFIFNKSVISYMKVFIGNIAGETNADFYIDDITITIAPPMVIETDSKNKYCEWPLNVLNNQGFENKATNIDWANLPSGAVIRTDKGAQGDGYLRIKAGTKYILPVKVSAGVNHYFSISTRLGKNSSGYVGVTLNANGTVFYEDASENPASKITVDTTKWSRDSFLFSASETGVVYLVFAADKGYIDIDEVHLYEQQYGHASDPNDHTKFVPYDYDNPDPSTVVLNGGDPTFGGEIEPDELEEYDDYEEEDYESPSTGDSVALPITMIFVALLAFAILVITKDRFFENSKGGRA